MVVNCATSCLYLSRSSRRTTLIVRKIIQLTKARVVHWYMQNNWRLSVCKTVRLKSILLPGILHARLYVNKKKLRQLHGHPRNLNRILHVLVLIFKTTPKASEGNLLFFHGISTCMRTWCLTQYSISDFMSKYIDTNSKLKCYNKSTWRMQTTLYMYMVCTLCEPQLVYPILRTKQFRCLHLCWMIKTKVGSLGKQSIAVHNHKLIIQACRVFNNLQNKF